MKLSLKYGLLISLVMVAFLCIVTYQNCYTKTTTTQLVGTEIVIFVALALIILYRISHHLQKLIKRVQKIAYAINIELPQKSKGDEISQLSTTLSKIELEIQERSRHLIEQQHMVDKYVIISATDLKGTITYASEAFCAISGYSKAELIGKNHRIVRHKDMPKKLYKELWESITQEKAWEGEIKNRKKDGTHYWIYAHIEPTYDRTGKHIGYRAIRQDITDKKRIQELSITDQLTKLYNRLKIDEVFTHEIAQAKRYATPLSIIMMDLDHFKSVNDTYGHQVGDEVLISLAKILLSQSRQADIVGRWGGEEFIIIAPNIDLNKAGEFAQKLRTTIAAHPFDQVGYKSASFGVSGYIDGDTQESMVKRADGALYQAKERGRDQVVLAIDANHYQSISPKG